MTEPTREQVEIAVRTLRDAEDFAPDDDAGYAALEAVADHLERVWKLGDQVPGVRDPRGQVGQ